MRTEIRNFRGIKAADLSLERIALVGGLNASGKSSLVHALAAALTGEVVPLVGMKKQDAGMLVHAGTGKGTVVVETEQGRIAIQYPQARLTSEGTPPAATAVAMGLSSILDMVPKDAQTAMMRYLKAEPAQADVAKFMAARGFEPKDADRLWALIGDLGWDGAQQHARDTGIKLKGQWEHVTGERYGPAKAEQWIPKDWASDLTGLSEDSLQAALTQAREFTDAANVLHCPHCRAGVVLESGKLVLASALPVEPAPAELKAAQAAFVAQEKAIADAWNKVKVLQGAHSGLLATSAGLGQDVEAAERAERTLQAAPVAEAEDAAQLEQARQGVRTAEQRLAAFQAKRRADTLHVSTGRNQIVVDALAPAGLRLTKLRAAIGEFNTELDALSKVAGWDKVELGEDLGVLYGGRPVVILSESERFRARVTLQFALAARDGSAMLAVDAADMLDRAGRNGLLRMAVKAGRPVLILMTFSDPADVPHLEAKGIGASWWMAAGQLGPLPAVNKAA